MRSVMTADYSTSRQHAPGRWLGLASVTTMLLVSGNLLNLSGIPYEDDGGLPFVKIHPGSYLAIAAGMVWLNRAALERARALRCPARFHLTAALLALLASLALAAAMTGAGGLIALIDTFLPAIMLALALSSASDAERSCLRRLLQWLLLANAVLAILESAAGANVIPSAVTDTARTEEFRPTALYDHPLTGASATLMMLFIAPSGARGIAFRAVALAALLAFGERIPLACGVLLLGVEIVRAGLRNPCALARKPGSVLAAIVFALAGTGGALAAGLGKRFTEHLYWDGSAQARILDFTILGQLTWPQLLLGCRREDLIALLEPMRLQSGAGVIENFWLLMLTTLGAFGFVAFCISFFSLLRALWLDAGPSSRSMILGLIATASTSNSLGRKSMLLTLLVACVFANPSVREPA